ncbi:hypothetical protein MMC12_001334 [Toensbergia leucococca]|nr:hypothetical protein [Toensbergia leucococca]
MPSIQKIILSLAFTAFVAAQSQISDGQIQAATSTAVAVSQITDGQIQATTATVVPVTQITDGQIQATTASATISSFTTANGTFSTGTASPSTFTGAANIMGWSKEIAGAAVGLAAGVVLL